MLFWNTVTPALKESLVVLMQMEVLNDFCLVGGTALSLQLGYRLSVDIDFFTDIEYGSVDFDNIQTALQSNFRYVEGNFGSNPGFGKSYLIGNSIGNLIKLDMYYTTEPFFQNPIIIDRVRMATIDEIVAMKIDIVQSIARKKDFWDLHELLSSYSIAEMIKLHGRRYTWTHDKN